MCNVGDIEEEDVRRFDHGDQSYAIYRDEGEDVFATDGWCTHGRGHLAEGLVIDGAIECPLHNGQFDFRTGAALRRPACEALKTFEIRIVAGRIQLKVPE